MRRKFTTVIAGLIPAAFVCVGLLLSFSSYAETISYQDSWGDAGFNLVSLDASGVEVVFSITEMAFEDIVIDGRVMQMVHLPGIILPNNPGAPNLPGDGKYIAIPQGASVSVSVIDSRTQVLRDIDMLPAAPIPLDTDDSPPVYERDENIYSRNAYYPESPVAVSEPMQVRGVDAVILGVTPFQYNPVTKELVIYRDLRVQVRFQGGNGHFGDDRLRSRFWEPVLQGNILNYSSLPQVNLNRIPDPNSEEDNVEYVIIVPDDPVFIAWADTIKQWRKQQGIITGITTLTEIGGNNATLIENYVNNAYNTWTIPPAAVLLLSDYQNSGDVYGITSPRWNNYCVSDNIYADINSDDLPDIHFARITAQSESHLSLLINKFLNYERTPPTSVNFYDQPLIAGGWQTERWFIICCEIVYGFWANQLGKHPVRQYAIYSGSPGSQWSTNQNTYMLVNYFGPTGLGYIPATPAHLTNWNGNAAGINAAINSGAFMVLHRDHGSETGWGEPAYDISNLSGLNNTDLTFVLSINCLTGKYDRTAGPCFAEAFHRHQYGALGIIAASEISYSFVNDTYIFGLFDSMYPLFDPGYPAPELMGANDMRPCMANSYGKHYLAASSWPYNPQHKTHTNNLFHHHGDAFITVNSEVPQNLTVQHNPVLFSGVTDFVVTANEGALIGLSVNNEIIGVAMGTGSPVSIPIAPQIPGQNMLVTATKANYYRYSQPVQIVPPSGPYVIYNSLDINDASGNRNGQLDYGENVLLSITVENVGIATANNVNAVIRTEDTYTTIIDSAAFYGNVQPGSTAVVTDGFQIEVAQTVPDMHNINFMLVATDGDSIWETPFAIPAHAPLVEFESLVINDPGGNNNNALDPGETADFVITIGNNGSCDVANVQVVISTLEPGITIPTNTANVAALAAGAQATVTYNGIQAAGTMPNGTSVDFNMAITGSGGYVNTDIFNITVGDERYMPVGPDNYGYLAYDSYDGYLGPTYSWIEIAPQAGGSGSVHTLGDDQTIQVNLPFTFNYYGQPHTQVSICSNGWVALGVQTSNAYSNTSIPSSGAPNNFVAPFWDDLYPPSGGQICSYHDQANRAFIVEFYQIQHLSAGGPETFEVLFYDPTYYPTVTGDGEFVAQYHTQSATTSATVGIENAQGTDGLQYLYNGSYHTNAMPLEPGFAIKYTTGSLAGPLFVNLFPTNPPIMIFRGGGTFEFDAEIRNITANPETFDAWINVLLPNGNWYGPLILRTGLSINAGATITRHLTQTVPGFAPSGWYDYWGHVGTFPNTVVSEDSFTFLKLGDDGAGSGYYDSWQLSGWDEGDAGIPLPTEYSMSQNYPNPFNPVTAIDFALPENAKVTITIYNVAGQRVEELYNGMMEAGYHSVFWNAAVLSSGVYFYELKAGDFHQIKKCVLMK